MKIKNLFLFFGLLFITGVIYADNPGEVVEETANYARVIDGLKSGMTVVAIFDDELEDSQQVTVK